MGNEILLNAMKLITLIYFIKFVISWQDVTVMQPKLVLIQWIRIYVKQTTWII